MQLYIAKKLQIANKMNKFFSSLNVIKLMANRPQRFFIITDTSLWRSLTIFNETNILFYKLYEPNSILMKPGSLQFSTSCYLVYRYRVWSKTRLRRWAFHPFVLNRSSLLRKQTLSAPVKLTPNRDICCITHRHFSITKSKNLCNETKNLFNYLYESNSMSPISLRG